MSLTIPVTWLLISSLKSSLNLLSCQCCIFIQTNKPPLHTETTNNNDYCSAGSLIVLVLKYWHDAIIVSEADAYVIAQICAFTRVWCPVLLTWIETNKYPPALQSHLTQEWMPSIRTGDKSQMLVGFSVLWNMAWNWLSQGNDKCLYLCICS